MSRPKASTKTTPQPAPNDSDLGEQAILKRVENYQPFTLETGVPVYYTSNVALVKNGEVGAVIIAPVVGLTYAPRFQRTLYGEFTLRQQFFYYSNDLSSFNFASFDAHRRPGLLRPEAAQPGLARQRRFNRLTGPITLTVSSQISDSVLNAEVPIPIGRAQQISLGTYANISLYADPQPPRRNDFGLYAGYAVNLSRNFSLNAATTLVVRPYDSGGRTDVSEILALSGNYRIRDWLTVSAVSSFVANQSNQSVFDYKCLQHRWRDLPELEVLATLSSSSWCVIFCLYRATRTRNDSKTDDFRTLRPSFAPAENT